MEIGSVDYTFCRKKNQSIFIKGFVSFLLFFFFRLPFPNPLRFKSLAIDLL